MGNITRLHQGSLNGLRRQINECLDSAYNKGYEDGKKEPREVKAVNVEDTNEYKIGYKVGYEDGKNEAIYNTELIPELKRQEYNKGFLDGFVVGQLMYNLICDHDIAEVKEWQDDKANIKVGDVVKCGDALMIVTRVDKISGYISGVCADGEYFDRDPSKWKKTGRHFDEVEQLLNKLKGDENDSY